MPKTHKEKLFKHILKNIKLITNNENREKVILSDLDYTLCHNYSFNHSTNDHVPNFENDLIEAAKLHHLIIATGRRANNPTIPLLWKSGLISPRVPVIAENGGVLVFKKSRGLKYLDLIDPDEIKTLKGVQKIIKDRIKKIPEKQNLIFKTGRTILITRLQDKNGLILSSHQSWLARQIRKEFNPSKFQITNTGVSVTIQPKGVNKWSAFKKYLELRKISRKEIFVISMGDSENDFDIFYNADSCIGFSKNVRLMVDFYIPYGARAAPLILKAINNQI